MSLTLEPFTTWIDRKRREIAAEEPLSIQTNIAALSQRLWKAEQTIEQVRRLIDRCDLCWATDDAEQSEHWDGIVPLGGDSLDGR